MTKQQIQEIITKYDNKIVTLQEKHDMQRKKRIKALELISTITVTILAVSAGYSIAVVLKLLL